MYHGDDGADSPDHIGEFPVAVDREAADTRGAIPLRLVAKADHLLGSGIELGMCSLGLAT